MAFSNDISLTEPELKEVAKFLVEKPFQVHTVVGATGTGKSTKIPGYVAQVGRRNMEAKGLEANPARSIVAVPTVVLAKALAGRATLHYPDLKVGYAAEGEVHYTDADDLVYATYGHVRRLYMRYLSRAVVSQSWQEFNSFRFLYLDEVHTGTVDISVLVSVWLKYFQLASLNFWRVPALVLMTATPVRPEVLFAGAESLAVHPEMHDYLIQRPSPFRVTEIYLEKPLQAFEIETKAATLAATIHRQKPIEEGHILIFVAGINEVFKIEEALQHKRFADAVVLGLYGAVDKDKREQATGAVPPGKRLILVATNVIESGVTIPDVGFVIDTMRERRPSRSSTGGIALTVHYITKNSARQRAGRTGRTRHGTVYRLMTRREYDGLEQDRQPDIYQVPIYNEVLDFIDLGLAPEEVLTDVTATVTATLNELNFIDAIHYNADFNRWETRPLGRFAARFPLAVRLSAFLWHWLQQGLPALPALVIVGLLEDDPASFFFYPRKIDSYATYVRAHWDDVVGRDHLETLLKLWIKVASQVHAEILFQSTTKGGSLARLEKWCNNNHFSFRALMGAIQTIRRCIKVARSLDYEVINGRFTADKVAAAARKVFAEVYKDKLFSFQVARGGYSRTGGPHKYVVLEGAGSIPIPTSPAYHPYQLIGVVTVESQNRLTGGFFYGIKFGIIPNLGPLEPSIPASSLDALQVDFKTLPSGAGTSRIRRRPTGASSVRTPALLPAVGGGQGLNAALPFQEASAASSSSSSLEVPSQEILDLF